nr:TssN family type VI secretion system protein [Flavobacterium oreochromis]
MFICIKIILTNSKKSEVWFVYFFILITVTYSFFSFAITHTFLNGPDLLYLMSSHFILFFIPQLIYDTFNLGMIIPAKVYKTWQFPVNYKEIAGVNDSEMRDLVVITFLIKKNMEIRNIDSTELKDQQG